MAYGAPHVGSPMVQHVRLARHLSLKVNSTPWVGTTRALFGTVLGHFWSFLVCTGPFLAPGANSATLCVAIHINGSEQGII